MNAEYSSVISVSGSAVRNVDPVLDALAPLIDSPPAAKRVLELASYPYEHIRHYAETWPGVQFAGTVRDAGEQQAVNTSMDSQPLPPNVAPPARLDIAHEHDWEQIRAATTETYDGVVMLNLVHCTPEGLPEHVFRNLAPEHGILAPRGWIAAYGAYLNDDGTYRSVGDEKFDNEHIKAVHPSLGLRTAASISAMASKYGFEEVERRDMPKGNLWIVWRAM